MRVALLAVAGCTLAAGAFTSAPLDASHVSAASLSALRNAPPPPLVEAARTGDLATLQSLLKKGSEVNDAAGDGMTALHWAAHHGNASMVSALLKAKASLTATTRLGDYTPLHVASRQGQHEVVALLLKAGADPNAATLTGATALHLAASAGDSMAVVELLNAKANPNAREEAWGQTPLMFAAAGNRDGAVRALMQGGADASLRTEVVDLKERTAREQAAQRRRDEVLFAMLPKAQQDSILDAQPAPAKKGSDDDDSDDNDDAEKGDAAEADSSDAKPAERKFIPGRNAPPTDQLTAAQIQIAIDSGRAMLLAQSERAAESDTTDGRVPDYAGTVGGMGGLTALLHAVRQGNREAALALVEEGADINQASATDSTTPLLMASINGHFDLADELLAKGADVKLASIAGATPLYAVINSQWLPRSRFPQPQAIQVQKTTYLELMEKMIDAGADVNVRLKSNLWYFAFNNCGNANCGLEYLDETTPFWRASYAVDVPAMRMLKARGADHTLPSERKDRPQRRVPGQSSELGQPAPSSTVAVAPAAPDVFAKLAAARAARLAKETGEQPGGTAASGDTKRTVEFPASAPAAGGRRPARPEPKLDPAIDSAAKAVPPGKGVYPIHAAAGVGYGNGFAGNSHRHAPGGWMPALKYLVEELGADVNQRDNRGFTPLHHAAARGDNEMILYLVSKGADVKAVSLRGQTTVDMANGPVQRLRPFPETIALLESLGAINSHKCVAC